MAAPVMEEAVEISDSLIPCSVCSRTFLPGPLVKHSRICEKNFAKKRKVFNSLKQRVEGTDLAPFHQPSPLKSRAVEESLESKKACSPKHNKWKEKHLQLVQAIRAAKGVPEKKRSGVSLSGTTSSSANERCPSCDRHFGPKAYDRHVEWCKEHKSRIQKSPACSQEAKERLEARIKYRVPPLNKSKRSVTREKYCSVMKRTGSVNSITSNTSVERILKSRKAPKPKPSNQDIKDAPFTTNRSTAKKPTNSRQPISKPATKQSSQPVAAVVDSGKNPAIRISFKDPKPKLNKTDVNDSIHGMTVSHLVPPTSSTKLVTWKDTLAVDKHKTSESSDSAKWRASRNTRSVTRIDKCSQTSPKPYPARESTFILGQCHSEWGSEPRAPVAWNHSKRARRHESSKSNPKKDVEKCASSCAITTAPPSKTESTDTNEELLTLMEPSDSKLHELESLYGDPENAWSASLNMAEIDKLPKKPFSLINVSQEKIDIFRCYSDTVLLKTNTSAADISLPVLTETSLSANRVESSETVFPLTSLPTTAAIINRDSNYSNATNSRIWDQAEKEFLMSYNDSSGYEKIYPSTQYLDENPANSSLEVSRLQDTSVSLEKLPGSSEQLDIEFDAGSPPANQESPPRSNLHSGRRSARNPESKENEFMDYIYTPGYIQNNEWMDNIVQISYIQDDKDAKSSSSNANTSSESDATLSPRLAQLLADIIQSSDEHLNNPSNVISKSTELVPLDSRSGIAALKEIAKKKSAYCCLPEIETKTREQVPTARKKDTEKIILPEIPNSCKANSKIPVATNFWEKQVRNRQSDCNPPEAITNRCNRKKVEYNPFISAEQQLKGLLKSSGLSPLPSESVKAARKSSSSLNNSKSSSIADQHSLRLKDDDAASLLEDNFELIERFIQCANELNATKSADVDSNCIIDPRLINESDDLTIPDDLPYDADEYSLASLKLGQGLEKASISLSYDEVEDMDEFISAFDDSEAYITLDDLSQMGAPQLPSRALRTKPYCSVKAGAPAPRKANNNLPSIKRSTSLLESAGKSRKAKEKFDPQNYAEDEKNDVGNEKTDQRIALDDNDDDRGPEELFAVDDKLYEEFKKYEEMYFKEKEDKISRGVADTNARKESDNEDERHSPPVQAVFCADSAYGSLNRQSAKAQPRARRQAMVTDPQESVLPNCPSGKNRRMSRFCHECGSKFPVDTAKFCVECGIKRLLL